MKPEGDLTLRTADAGDVADIADLFLACWRTSYRGVLPARVIDMYGPASALELWQRSFADGPDRRAVIVAVRPDLAIEGVISIGRDPDHPSDAHVFSLYVHPDAQGLGIGARLMSAARERFRADGLSRASLWVFQANAAGRAFYERLGWTADGGTRVEPEYGEPELRLTRSL